MILVSFLLLINLFSCSEKNVNEHIQNLIRINSSIKPGIWKINHYTDFGFEDNHFNAIFLFDSDTFYHFKCKKENVKNNNRRIIDYDDKIFLKGKYYYMWKNNKFDLRQDTFFRIKFDSLRKIRGNDLPELFVPDSIQIDTSYFDYDITEDEIDEVSNSNWLDFEWFPFKKYSI